MNIIYPYAFAELDDKKLQLLSDMQKSHMSKLMNARNLPLNKEWCKWIVKRIKEISNIIIPDDKIAIIFELYPQERIGIITSGHCDDETYDCINFVIAHYFGSTIWPVKSDLVNMEVFINKLQTCAKNMGYEIGEIK